MGIADVRQPLLPALGAFSDARLEQSREAAQRGGTQETARQFEQLFATLMVRELRRSMPQSPFGQGPGAEVYEGWFDEHLGTALARADALGIARLVGGGIERPAEGEAR